LGTAEEGVERPAGGRALLLLAVPFHVRLLTFLVTGPHSLTELRAAIGSPPDTTIRDHMGALAAAGAVEKRRRGGFPGSVDYRLTAAGHDLIGVAETFSEWLAQAPDGRKQLGTVFAKRVTRALVEGWGTGLVRALAVRPTSLTELSEAIPRLSYPAVERRFTSMRRLGLLKVVPSGGRATPCTLSDWLRTATIPLESASRWERRWLGAGREEGASPLTLAPTP
jgi:DNA-binding HxlR family transcriptional regulator